MPICAWRKAGASLTPSHTYRPCGPLFEKLSPTETFPPAEYRRIPRNPLVEHRQGWTRRTNLAFQADRMSHDAGCCRSVARHHYHANAQRLQLVIRLAVSGRGGSLSATIPAIFISAGGPAATASTRNPEPRVPSPQPLHRVTPVPERRQPRRHFYDAQCGAMGIRHRCFHILVAGSNGTKWTSSADRMRASSPRRPGQLYPLNPARHPSWPAPRVAERGLRRSRAKRERRLL